MGMPLNIKRVPRNRELIPVGITRGKALTKDDRIVIQKWAETVRDYGPDALLKNPSIWADHPLTGKWEGYRASSFSYSGRIIYRIDHEKKQVVIVARITVDHNYKR
jgi:mRNA-degrading endonuclease YafQ of YafQ-DinJ toxin-antitoxin module